MALPGGESGADDPEISAGRKAFSHIFRGEGDYKGTGAGL